MTDSHSHTLPLPSSLTPSKLAAFKECPLAFRYAHIDRLPQPPSPAAEKGTLAHAILEALYWEYPQGMRTHEVAKTLTSREISRYFDSPTWHTLSQMDANNTHAEQFTELFAQQVATFVQNYFLLEDPNNVTAIGMELVVETRMNIQSATPPLSRGIIDRLDLLPNGDIVVVDYKTGREPDERMQNEKLTGVAYYAMLCERVFGRSPSSVKLLYLSTPAIVEVQTTPQLTRGIQTKAHAAWTAIEKACSVGEFRPKVGRACRWCAFKEFCPAQGGTLRDIAENADTAERIDNKTKHVEEETDEGTDEGAGTGAGA